ncbi:hypothetical protein KY328_03535 [Candidatus Woesearchaeota archaeon]|nr:hypothetical protein [Candidatus Woesearchaeota archaeon]MBW3021967.1 hypothetical protein [Candidatus Woesearchaeota archaeon]
MVYACDVVDELVSNLCKKGDSPVMFQRDGSMYKIGRNIMGVTSFGVPMVRVHKQPAPAVFEVSDNALDDEGKFVKSEIHRFGPLVYEYQPGLCLSEVETIYLALNRLGNDGKVRLIRQSGEKRGDHYNEHTLYFPGDARIMEREKYMELLRQREQEILEKIGKATATDLRGVDVALYKCQFPDCAIITPDYIITFPRKGVLNNSTCSEWSRSTRFNDFSWQERILRWRKPQVERESPYTATVKVNSRESSDIRDLSSRLHALGETMDFIEHHLGPAREFVDEFNTLHNKVCAKDIARRKRWENKTG